MKTCSDATAELLTFVGVCRSSDMAFAFIVEKVIKEVVKYVGV